MDIHVLIFFLSSLFFLITCVCCCVLIDDEAEENSSTPEEPPEISQIRNEPELLELVANNAQSAPIAVNIIDDLPPTYEDALKY
jgi:hypothetical protein